MTETISDTNVETWTFRGYEMVVGLEVHVELATRTKLFSASPNRFGDEPNTNIDPVTLGLPGALPVLNRQAVELAMRLGLALDCKVQRSTFARKNYFYPDMPKAYQISQYDEPICIDGWLDLPGSIRVGIERAHLEEDTGKSTHVGGSGGRIHGSDFSLIDFNRAGVPLVEIVSRPDIRTPDQAKAYVSELRAMLVAVGASDAKMEEGSMRVDANVSVRLPGAEFGTRCEIKNVNSVRSVGRAIEYEAQRQVGMLEAGESIRQETRHWDETDGRTHTLRSKEDADDYRYFQEPDLVVVDPDPARRMALSCLSEFLDRARLSISKGAGRFDYEKLLLVITQQCRSANPLRWEVAVEWLDALLCVGQGDLLPYTAELLDMLMRLLAHTMGRKELARIEGVAQNTFEGLREMAVTDLREGVGSIVGLDLKRIMKVIIAGVEGRCIITRYRLQLRACSFPRRAKIPNPCPQKSPNLAAPAWWLCFCIA